MVAVARVWCADTGILKGDAGVVVVWLVDVWWDDVWWGDVWWDGVLWEG